MLEFRILGPLEVLDQGSPVQFGGRNQRALLTLLLLRVNEPVSSERLVNELWGEHPPRTATTSLQNAVSQLRKLLGPGLLHTRPAGYVLELDGDQLDLVRFERLVREARALEPPERAKNLREALALWRGAPLADSELEDFAQSEIHRLEDLRLGVLEDRIAADLEVEVDSELVAEVESLVRRHPLRERLRAQLMLALYRSGRQADALTSYHDARRTLVDELGIEPGPELQALYGSILRQERSLVRQAPPALDDHYDEVLRALSAGRRPPAPSTVTSWRSSWRSASSSIRAGAAFRTCRSRSRRGTGSGRCTTSCTWRSTATSSPRRCMRGWAACRRSSACAGSRSS
jgi:DNA-binding SARP family transcriptional activator